MRQYDAQLQHDVTAIVAETAILRHAADRLHGRPCALERSLGSGRP
jgi:hypothetical protein